MCLIIYFIELIESQTIVNICSMEITNFCIHCYESMDIFIIPYTAAQP